MESEIIKKAARGDPEALTLLIDKYKDIGLVLLIWYNGEWIYETGMTEHHGILILTISLLFLVFKWLEEVVVSRKYCRI